LKRLVYVGSTQDVERLAAGRNAMPLCPADAGQSPLAGLIMLEIRRIEKWTRMTELQAVVLEWSLKGFTPAEIAELRGMKANAVIAVLERAHEKCRTYPYRGLLTVLVEECGWEEVQELLANR